MLSEAVLSADRSRIGDVASLWPYARRFHRDHGPLLAMYDLVRRFTQQLSTDECEELFASGLARPSTIHAALLQRMAAFTASDVRALARAVIHAPRLVAKMAAVSARAGLCAVQARGYPEKPDLAALMKYESRLASSLGVEPDPIGVNVA
jgi:hypothetical protein